MALTTHQKEFINALGPFVEPEILAGLGNTFLDASNSGNVDLNTLTSMIRDLGIEGLLDQGEYSVDSPEVIRALAATKNVFYESVNSGLGDGELNIISPLIDIARDQLGRDGDASDLTVADLELFQIAVKQDEVDISGFLSEQQIETFINMSPKDLRSVVQALGAMQKAAHAFAKDTLGGEYLTMVESGLFSNAAGRQVAASMISTMLADDANHLGTTLLPLIGMENKIALMKALDGGENLSADALRALIDEALVAADVALNVEMNPDFDMAEFVAEGGVVPGAFPMPEPPVSDNGKAK